MSEKSGGEFGWLSKYRLSIEDLDPDVRRLLSDLGEEGVDRLVEAARNTRPYRNRRMIKGERVSVLEQLQRLSEQGGGEWARGEPSIGGDTPRTWIGDEEEYLSEE